MDSIKLIKHSESTPQDINQVIAIKKKAWPYPFDSQLKWIEDNLSPEDIHVFLLADGENAAYLNLVKTRVSINGVSLEAYGLGNVCACIKGRGYGRKLIILTNAFLENNNKMGLLFCRSTLIGFYSICNWTLLPSEKCIEPVLVRGIHIMTYNAPTEIETFKYIGKFF